MTALSLLGRLSRLFFKIRKPLHQLFARYTGEQSIVFILGCQRSGTTMLVEMFQRDLDAKSYGEYSKLTSNDKNKHVRLNPLETVAQTLARDRAPLITLKPLVESQNAARLLEFFPNSFVLLAYRNFRDVAQSNIKFFGLDNGKIDLRPIVADEPNNWRSQNVSDNTREIVLRHFSEHMNPPDAHVLCWYARNILFFEQNLHVHPRVILCRYEELVSNPADVMRFIYEQVGQRFPGYSMTVNVHAQSIGKGRELDISAAITDLADGLLKQLDGIYYRSQA